MATWNIESLTEKLMELTNTITRGRINIACLQETKRIREKVIKDDDFKLWYIGKAKNKNRVRIIIYKSLKDEIIHIKRIRARIILIKLILGEESINVINTYVP